MPNHESLRIIHVLRAPMGGLFRHVRDLAEAHAAEGHMVGVICDVPGTTGYNEEMAAGLASSLPLGLHRVGMRREIGIRDLAGAGELLRLIKSLQPDVLHGHGAKGGVYARALGSLVRAGRSRVARLYSPHGGSLHYDRASRSGQVYFRIERALERLTDHILFVAEYERRTYREKVGEPRCSWTVNYNGLRDTEFEPVKPVATPADFLFLGEMRMLKGPDLFLQALDKVRARGNPGVRAIMVGAGPDTSAIRSLADSLDLSGSVAFRPPMTAREAFSMARVFVMPSRAEALPYVTLEALAAGMPVIATAVGGIPEIFGTDSLALVAPDADDLAEKMAAAIADPAGYSATMPDRDTLTARFSARAMADTAMQAYRSALALRR
ncbi:glycosyltransferase family 4 protein [Oricola thermophila]|uniref:Glycosyltransferase family 4 protein n=1 Tax=Oricola thermophila TaxID=2742145 RepID=A0A6N1VBG6_9HYPH|nr:glycosyltransferase family 4 protein [Oricola thermophila]QKV18326.1 glycosyltransferase family 4 protein [Oricola thermophila]